MEMSENTKFQNTAGSDILIAKSGISNHAASNILDDLCFSKFGTFHGGCPQSADNFRTFVCAPLLAPESPLIVCGFAGHTPGTVQTWKDTELDVRRGTEEILGFCFKELPPLVVFWNFIFSNILIIKHIPF